MLSRAPSSRPSAADQRGVVLLVALIILVALSLGGIALVRSVGTANVIAGNLAFQQAATQSGEAGTQAAISNIEAGGVNSSGVLALTDTDLQSDNFARAYSASMVVAGNPDPADGDALWAVINPSSAATPGTCQNRVCTLAADAAGNIVSYTIQRLCQTAGNPVLATTGCAVANQEASLTGTGLKPGQKVYPPLQYYYRITSRIAGPRNTVSYIQTIVAR